MIRKAFGVDDASLILPPFPATAGQWYVQLSSRIDAGLFWDGAVLSNFRCNFDFCPSLLEPCTVHPSMTHL